MINSTYNKQHIARAFSRSAKTYDEVAILQRTIAQDLLNLVKKTIVFPKKQKLILDLGSGTGHTTQKLALQFPESKIIALDLAFGMLNYAQQYSKNNIEQLCADAENLPFQNNCYDLIFSNLMLQWSPDYEKTLQEIDRTLKPNGIFLLTTLGPDTLQELRYCWQQVDNFPHVHSFVPRDALLHTINKSKLSILSIEAKKHYRYFSKTIDLMKELKMLGASNIQINRDKSLTSHEKLQSVFNHYEQFRNKAGFIPATYEVYFIIAKKVL